MTVVKESTAQAIKTLWRHHVPPKVIAAALDLKYHTVTMYIRGFKATSHQFDPEYVVANILGIKKYTKEFLKMHVSSGQSLTHKPAFGPAHMEAKLNAKKASSKQRGAK